MLPHIKILLNRRNAIKKICLCGTGIVALPFFPELTFGINTARRSKKTDLTLKYFANQRGLEIGSQIVSSRLDDRAYTALLEKHFTRAVIDGDLHWMHCRPEKSTFRFHTADKLVTYCNKNNLKLEVHHLLWGNQLPKWLLKGNFTTKEIFNIAENHISTLVSRYRGKVKAWTVLNEIFGNHWGKGGFWRDATTDRFPEFMEKCFQWAHDADPDASLLWSDGVGTELYGGEKSEKTYTTVKKLIKKGVPIHGIGLHYHLLSVGELGDVGAMTNSLKRRALLIRLKKNIERYQNIGMEFIVNELDVNLSNVGGQQSERYAFQAEIYKEFVSTFLESGVKKISFFGFSDLVTWYKKIGNPTAQPLLFDENFMPKPAFFSVINVLKKR